jgi:hypothetical protein
VTSVTLHPSRHYFVTSSMDRTWCFCDLATGSSLLQVADDQVGCDLRQQARPLPPSAEGPGLGVGPEASVQPLSK